MTIVTNDKRTRCVCVLYQDEGMMESVCYHVFKVKTGCYFFPRPG